MKNLALLLGVICGCQASAAGGPELFLYGEKPGITEEKPLGTESPIRLHLARGGFASFMLRLPEEGKRRIVALESPGFVAKPPVGHKPVLNVYAVGVQKIERSSYLRKNVDGLEAPEIGRAHV